MPALALRQTIVDACRDNLSVIIRGATGSGKSTQVPQYIAEMLKLRQIPGRKVICTQPRKVAAEALAARVSEEWDRHHSKDKLGLTVGYSVGGMKKCSRSTIIEYQTEGTLLGSLLQSSAPGKVSITLEDEGNEDEGEEKIEGQQGGGKKRAELIRNPLSNVGAIILDEAHERSVTLDVIVGILLEGQRDGRWPTLRIIVTSATLDVELFSRYLGGVPIVEIPGRMYSVDVIYRPLRDADYVRAAVLQAFEIHTGTPINSGDILVFLTGEAECLKAVESLAQNLHKTGEGKRSKVLPLYGRQLREEQELVFTPPSSTCRKIIFSTDIAETSLTIDGVRHVVDTGMSKETVYDAKRNVTVLETSQISKSSATQRKGRAGRTCPGTCYKLYTEDQEKHMRATQIAEVLSKPLDQTVITVRAMGIDPLTFNWLEAPSHEALAAAEKDLVYLGAIDGSTGTLTDIGKLSAKLQIEPSLARLLYFGCKDGAGESAAALAGLLSVGSAIFWRPGKSNKDPTLLQKIEESHRKFYSPEGDAATLFRVYTAYNGILWGIAETADGDETGEEPKFEVVSEGNEGDFLTLQDLKIEKSPDAAEIVYGNDGDDIIDELDEDSNEDCASVDELSVDSDSSLDSVVTADTLDSLDSEAASNAMNEMEEATEEERIEKRFHKKANTRVLKDWCSENYINQKSLNLALITARDLIRAAKAIGIWRLSRDQNKELSDLDIRRLVVHGYFLNIASLGGASSPGKSAQYNILRTENISRGIFDSNSVMTQHLDPPAWY